MKTIYKAILLLSLTLFLAQETMATHLSGGQITWVCRPNGKYRFKLSVYEACEGGNATNVGAGGSLCVYNHPTITTIALVEGINREISQPGCKSVNNAIKCGNNKEGAMREILLESADIDLGNYVPGVNGWWFVYTNCCRPNTTINVAGSSPFTLRSAMYAYQGKKAKPCYDNSPVFTELPVGIIAKNQPFNYNPNSNDADWDSLTVDWGNSMTDVWLDGSSANCHIGAGAAHWKATMPNENHPQHIIYNAPYAFNNPVGAIQAPPIPPAVVSDPILDPSTGAFSFVVPNTVADGMYVFCIKTTAFRSGIKIAEVYRDYLFTIYPSQLNKIPTIPKMQFNTNAIPTANGYELNVNAGDLIDFNITSQDTITQENLLTTTGLQYGAFNGFNTINPTTLYVTTKCNTPPCLATGAGGCGTPPCAQFTFTSKNPFAPPAVIPAIGGYGQVTGFFSWQTDCNHTKNLKTAGMGGTNTQKFNTFQFQFKSIDNMCPVPGFRYQFVRINVYPTPVLPSPELRCLKVLNDGNVELSWKPLDTTNSKNSFSKFIVYRDGLAIDSSVIDPAIGSYTDNIPFVYGKNANLDTLSYMVLTRMGCSHRLLSKEARDTMKTLFINVKLDPTKRSRAIISWNKMNAPKLKTAHPKYDVFRKDDVLINWTKIGDTDTLFYLDSVTTCPKNVYYRVELKDSLPCTSVSNIDSLFYGDSLVIPLALPPDIRCVDVKDNGKIQLTWAPATQTALATNFQRYYIYRIDNPSFTFDLIDSSITNINTNTFIDAPAGGLLPPALPANGQKTSFNYFIQTLSGCNGVYVNKEKDTLKSMLLTATNVLYSKLVKLKWNAIHTPLKPSAGLIYDIYRTELSNPGGWNSIASVASNKTTYTDTVSSCDEKYLYKIAIQDALGCISFSSKDTVHIVDTTFLPRVKSPSLRCASVAVNGNVTLNWTQSKDTLNSFYGYTIWRSSTAAGPFVLIDSINTITTTTYTDVAATVNAQNQSYYYYIGTWSGCGDHLKMPPLDTLKTMKLVVSGSGGSIANLSWNTLHTPVLATANPNYEIYREYPVNSGKWFKVGTSNTPSFKDTVNICNGTVRYRVEAKDSIGCTSVSSFDSGSFQDKINTDQMMLDSVSVTVGANITHLGWTPSASGDVVKYIIYFYNGQANIPIDTVSTPFFDDNRVVSGKGGFADPDKYVVSYIIASVDSCGNVSSYNSNNYSILLKGTMDNCLNQTSLTWNPYVGWPGNNVDGYNIYASANGGAYTLVGTNAGNDESYVHTGLQKGYTYSYYVRAISKAYTNPSSVPLAPRISTASSNEINLICTQPRQPKFIYLTHATVVDNNTVEVRALTDTSRYALKYRVGRSLFENGPFKEVASVPYQSSDPFISIKNTKDTYTDSLSYVYNVTVYDSCGNEIMTSNIGKTILLKAYSDISLKTVLNWSAYVDFDKKVGHYKLFRFVDGKGKGEYIGRVNGNTLTYNDDVTRFSTTAGYFCYKVIAYEDQINKYGIQDSSISNLACTQLPPTLYVPNAFIPESGIDANKIFIPRGMFISPDQYEFIIFDRWGVKQFYTQNPKESWDGMSKGEQAKQDVYVWIVRYKDQYGNVVEKNGTVTLLR